MGDVVFGALVLVAVYVRARALAKAGAPPGFDGGDWLALGRGLFGREVRPGGLAASPVVPTLTYASVSVVGAQAAFVSMGAALSVFPGAGVFMVLRRRVPSIDAALVSALVVACFASGEAASWGGYPQLLALGFLPPAVALVDRAFDEGDQSLAALAGCALLAVALTSDFVFSFAALAAGVIVLGRLKDLVGFKGWRAVGKLLVALVVPLLAAVPLLVEVGRARVAAVLDPAGTAASSPSAIDRINFVFSDRTLMWRVVLLGGAAGLALLWERRFETHWRVAAALGVVAFGLTAAFDEPRLAYLLPTASALALALWSPELRRLSRVPFFSILAAVACLAQFQTLPSTARLQAAYYQALTPPMVEAIEWLGSHTDGSSLVAVTPYKDGPALGWWIEGLAAVHTLTGSNLRWLHFDAERTTARQAAEIFADGVPTLTQLHQARTMRVTFVFIDKRWGSFQARRVSVLRHSDPSTVAFENRAAVVLRTASSNDHDTAILKRDDAR